jgi:SSS family solute:Na+ symporter
MVTFYDYLNIGFYFAFIVGVGMYFARKSRNTSDYFRGGGVMPWWVTGASTWMAGFSAWTFTGAAGKMYETGPYALMLFFANIPALVVILFFTCYRFRRMRVVTPLEAVRLRFGPVSQQFYTWVRLPFLLLFGGIGLNAVGIFMAAVTGIDLITVMIVLGLVVVIVSLLGGSFGVAASDFVQMFLVVTVAVTVVVLALKQPAVGGLSGLLERVPEKHFSWSQIARPQFVFFWILALSLNSILAQNSMEVSAKYLMSRSDRHARLTLIIPLIGTFLGSMLFAIPPMAAAITNPNLAAQFPQLAFPNEAAYLATAANVLPAGMLGLLMCGIFAATLTTLDASLNQGAGIFVRNFYLPIVNPACTEKKLLIVSKLCTGLFGAIIIGIAVVFSKFRTLGLFDVLNQLGVSLMLPLAIPLTLGIFYKRTPGWSTWTTVLLGLSVSFFARLVLKPDMLTWIPGLEGPFNAEETTQLYIFATVALVGIACIAWFFFTSLFYDRSPDSYKASVEDFFSRLKQPMGTLPDEVAPENTAIEGTIGVLCMIYGSFLMLLAAIPNPWSGRLCFIASGGAMLLVGSFIRWHYRLKTAKAV